MPPWPDPLLAPQTVQRLYHRPDGSFIIRNQVRDVFVRERPSSSAFRPGSCKHPDMSHFLGKGFGKSSRPPDGGMVR